MPPLDSMPHDLELDELRRRAGIPTAPQPAPTTQAYDQLNPGAINVPMSEADLTALIAVLEYVQQVKELIPTSQLLFKLKKLVGRHKGQPHNPRSPDNPFRQEVMLGPDEGNISAEPKLGP